MSEESNSNGKRERVEEDNIPSEEEPRPKSLRSSDDSDSNVGKEETASAEANEDAAGKDDPPSEEPKEAKGDANTSDEKKEGFEVDRKGAPEETQPPADAAAAEAPSAVPEVAPAAPVPAPAGVDPYVQATVVMTPQVVEERGEIPALYVGKVIGKVRSYAESCHLFRFSALPLLKVFVSCT